LRFEAVDNGATASDQDVTISASFVFSLKTREVQEIRQCAIQSRVFFKQL
jgi:hypothetical protein